MQHHFYAEYKNCLIRPVRQDDIELLRIWRNNQTLSKYLTPVGMITPEMQKEWFERNQQDPNIITFAVEETQTYKRLVGSASLYDFHDDIAEVGKTMIGDDEARGKSLGFYSELMTVCVGIRKLGLNTIIARIHENNLASMKRAKRLGYSVIGKHPFEGGGYECELKTSKAQFEACHPFLSEIKIYEK